MGDLKHAMGSVETVRGRVSVSWERDGGRFTCRVSVPPGATASVHLPVPEGQFAVTEGEGTASSHAPAGMIADGGYSFEIDSGDYLFEVMSTEESRDGDTNNAAD